MSEMNFTTLFPLLKRISHFFHGIDRWALVVCKDKTVFVHPVHAVNYLTGLTVTAGIDGNHPHSVCPLITLPLKEGNFLTVLRKWNMLL